MHPIHQRFGKVDPPIVIIVADILPVLVPVEKRAEAGSLSDVRRR
jgi:hypothetical protein